MSKLSEIQQRAVLRELAAREQRVAQQGVAAVATEAELEAANLLEGKLFPQQHAFFFDTSSRLRVACCTRRAGKSTGDAIKILVTLLRSPRAVCLYIAQTSSTAREVLWPVLKELVADFDLPFNFSETHLRLEHKRSSGKLLLRGADTVKDVEKLRGLKLKAAIIDESGTFGAQMEDLVLSVIGPALRDENGELLLNGTPGYYPAGLFYETSSKMRKGWAVHRWSLVDNPFLSETAKSLDIISEEEGLTKDDPRFIREYMGQYAINTKTQAFAFDPAVNTYTEEPPHGLTWYLGVDFGWTDETAIVAIGFKPNDSRIWVGDTWSAPQQTSDDVAAHLKEFQAKYSPKRIVGDLGGGGGKATAEQIWRDYQIYIEAAEKTEKLRHIEFVNSAFRRKDLLIPRGSKLADELYKVLWNEAKTDFHNKAKDNLSMAMVYAWRQAANVAGRTKARPSGAAALESLKGAIDPQRYDEILLEAGDPPEALHWFLKPV